MKGLARKFEKRVSIIGLPSGEFKNQEFSEDHDIAKFLDDRLHINQKDTPNLIILSRSNIRKDPVSPLWTFLKKHSDKDADLRTRWNFSTTFIVTGGNRIIRLDDVEFDEIESAISERTQIGKM